MTPILFINCSKHPFVQEIMNRQKLFETRTRQTLRALVGQTVMIAETGKGKPVVRCTANVAGVVEIRTLADFEKYRDQVCIPSGSDFDWKDTTNVKYLYKLENVAKVDPFVPAEGIRHGRVWMEYNGKHGE